MARGASQRWQSKDGSVRLYCGDCLDILPRLRGVDSVVTDPPYGIGLANNDRDGHRSQRTFTIAGDHSQEAGSAVLDWAERQALPTIAFASPWRPWPGKWRNLIAWNKGGAVGGGGDIRTCLKRSWEIIQVARNGAMNGPRDESVWSHPMVPSDTVDHICAKPESLMCRLLLRFSNPGDTILDPFMGSGTTVVAAVRTGRSAIGIEREPRYFEISVNRIKQALKERRALIAA